MTRPPFEVADIIRQYGTRFIEAHRAWLTTQHLRVLRAIAHCRTAALGGHLDRCAACGHRAISFNSCRNRHCPKCLTHARDQWLAERERELLPVGYAHVVFTLPHALARLALQNKRVVYDLLFQASAATLLEVARTPKHLGAALGFLSVLHTWGQTLLHHPHVHCVVPAGGLSPDGTRWVHARPSFFLPVKVLSRVFRGKFVAGLIDAFRAGTLTLPTDLHRLTDESAFRAWLRTLYRHDWIVYAKPPFGGPGHVLHYLARYTHRVAISNHRLVDVRRRPGDVSVEGLPPREPGPPHDPQRGGIPPALLPPRAAERFRADPVLRVSRPSLSHRGVVTLPVRARRESTTGPRGLRRRHVDARGLASVSPLRWSRWSPSNDSPHARSPCRLFIEGLALDSS